MMEYAAKSCWVATTETAIVQKKNILEIKGTNNWMGHGFPPKFHNS